MIFKRPSALLTRIFGILLLAIVFEFAASTLFYERVARLQVREEEAHRLAEHLALGYRLVGSRPAAERIALAARISSDKFRFEWRKSPPPLPAIAPELRTMRDQIVQWEPTLARSDLRLYLAGGRGHVVAGIASLPDGSTVRFEAAHVVESASIAANRFLLAIIPAVALIIIAGLMIRRTLRPMGELARAAEAVGQGRELLVEERGPGEVRRVIRAFNAMQTRIHRLIADRTQALAAAGHDLRTPLARLRLRSEAIADADLRKAIFGDLGEMEEMIESLLAYFGGETDPQPPVRVDLAVLIDTLVDEVRDLGGAVTYAGPRHAEMQLRPAAIKRALRNLVDNGLHYGGGADVSLRMTNDWAIIAVEDDGPGIPEDRMEEALRPFSRLDGARARNTAGLGLGLSIVERIVRSEGGDFRIANRSVRGLRAEIRLPLAPPKND
ncbi:ATP-binding protein [Sphingosinicella sp. BN140058]|uniref:ATP-binding protein n=1 Tax=Sphingosinicella sp. BN140058 TaxID=1892855 RepID=UPI0010133012|nr:ATP-binding protein [Sphingosinicella sp. BN140058]QAY79221.1 HAMP domain-containing protein [Sphingosinicella sp. BN140058]